MHVPLGVRFVAALTAVTLFAGCTTINPYTREGKENWAKEVEIQVSA